MKIPWEQIEELTKYLKENEVFKFGSTDAQPNSALGFGFKYNENRLDCQTKNLLHIQGVVKNVLFN